MTEVEKLIVAYCDARRDLMRWADDHFPRDAVVWVQGQTRHGIVSGHGDCPLDKLPVLMESGNVWWYPLTEIRLEPNVRSWPRWIRKLKLNWKLRQIARDR